MKVKYKNSRKVPISLDDNQITGMRYIIHTLNHAGKLLQYIHLNKKLQMMTQ